MASPFRHNKKQRKAMRKRAKAEVELAEKLEARGNQSEAVLRKMAELNIKLSLVKRKKSKVKICINTVTPD